MCLAVPGRIKKIQDGRTALVDFMGVEKTIALDLIENPREGEFVIVHAGFAINRLSKEDAAESLQLFRELQRRQTTEE